MLSPLQWFAPESGFAVNNNADSGSGENPILRIFGLGLVLHRPLPLPSVFVVRDAF
jgi:hypothetical protein